MRIVVLGAGAMGSVFGARLHLGGAEVTLLDVNEAHIAAVRETGLSVALDEGTQVLDIPIMRPEVFEDPADLILLFTKIFHTDAALQTIRRHLNSTPVLSLQNGIGNVERIARHLPMERILIGMTMTPAEFIAPGKVASYGPATTQFHAADGQHRQLLDDIAAAMRAGGIDAAIDPDIQAAIWEKAAFNCAMNGLCALSNATPGAIGASEAGRTLAFEVADEAVSVARASGVAADPDKVRALMRHAFAQHLFHEASMLQDRKAGRRTEIDALNGAVSETAARLGIATPANNTIARLVRLFEDAKDWMTHHQSKA